MHKALWIPSQKCPEFQPNHVQDMRKSVQRVLYMTIRGSVMLLEICLISWNLAERDHILTLLCGRTDAPLTYSSSLIVTSSPRTVMFSTRVWMSAVYHSSEQSPTHPSTDIAVPANNTVRDPRMIPDHRIAHDDTSLETDTRANLHTGTNDDVGAEDGGRVDFCGLRC